MISVQPIIDLHQQTVDQWHQGEMDNSYPANSLLSTVCQQHQFNYLLWHEEDIARSNAVSDSEIARVKRAIDRYNQQRNDWIEKLDDTIAEMIEQAGVSLQPSAPINTETPGSAIDRLSILSLRIYHLNEQLERSDVDEQHIRSVNQKLAICQLQRSELATALQSLLDDFFRGNKRHRIYRQLKMYNDPTLNPYLYRIRAERIAEMGSSGS